MLSIGGGSGLEIPFKLWPFPKRRLVRRKPASHLPVPGACRNGKPCTSVTGAARRPPDLSQICANEVLFQRHSAASTWLLLPAPRPIGGDMGPGLLHNFPSKEAFLKALIARPSRGNRQRSGIASDSAKSPSALCRGTLFVRSLIAARGRARSSRIDVVHLEGTAPKVMGDDHTSGIEGDGSCCSRLETT
jgi:hypothetical protein